MVPPSSHRVSRVRRYSGFSLRLSHFAYVTFTLFRWLSHTIQLCSCLRPAVRTPKVLLPPVWPLPLSLATTQGISVDVFSSPYLDVSVQAVPHICLWIQHMLHGHDSMWVSPFRNLRINAYLQLPEAYRSLSRLSSAPSAKAFTLCPFLLDQFYIACSIT